MHMYKPHQRQLQNIVVATQFVYFVSLVLPSVEVAGDVAEVAGDVAASVAPGPAVSNPSSPNPSPPAFITSDPVPAEISIDDAGVFLCVADMNEACHAYG